MSEYTERRWKCDFCGRDVKREPDRPRWWAEIRVDYYGNSVHCCDVLACHDKLKEEYGDNEYAADDLKRFLSPKAKSVVRLVKKQVKEPEFKGKP